MQSGVTVSKLLINGLVQGVGFRPTVYKVAQQLGLYGWVKNTSLGVEVVINTPDAQVFMHKLEDDLPRLASLDSIEIQQICLDYELTSFTILPSSAGAVNDTIMPPDSYLCQDCLGELFDPNSKYYLYPFTNCTNCGPRYSVIRGLPYDRPLTALANFPLCESCCAEYTDSNNRRYHAQATACPNCGPQLDAELSEIAESLRLGKIVALKGVGGYALLADAKNSVTLQQLRQRKKRSSKPFALMALNVTSIRHFYAQVSEHDAGLLESTAAPIVLLAKKNRSNVAKEVAPDLATLGFMLPNSPIHYLLFYYLLGKPSGDWLSKAQDIVIVVTSANFSGGTIISDNLEAQEQLNAIADVVVSYNRDIVMKSDDSVMMNCGKHDVLLRRARGFAPKPYYFSYHLPQVLGLGAQLKNTLTFTRGNKAFTSQYLGDMSSEHTIKYFKQVLAHFDQVFNFKPELIVSDAHPDFFVTQYAQQLGVEHIQLQHHFAHFAATIGNAESCGKKIQPTLLGCILDGYGYGLNGEAWGGELIKCTRANLQFEVVSHLVPLCVPGGDIAEREPWRIALAYCVENNLALPEHLASQPQAAILGKLIESQQFGVSRAFGRFFSLVAGLLNIVTLANYEAHAAMVLESLVSKPVVEHDFVRLNKQGQPDFNLLINRIYKIGLVEKDINRAVNVFYGSIAALIEKWIIYHCSLNGIRQVAISGGCWQSRHLLAMLSEQLPRLGIELLVPYQMPMNDECISFGQAWYGAQLKLMEKSKCV